MSTNKGKLIAFYITDESHLAQLQVLATRAGFKSIALYVRALAEKHLDMPDQQIAMRRVGELRSIVQANVIRMVANSFASITAEDLLSGEQ